MANTIKLKQGSGSNPSASDLVVGEVALRTDGNPKLFTKNDAGNVLEVGLDSLNDKLPLTGGTLTGNLTISNTQPIISLTDTNANSDFQIKVDGGHFDIKDVTNGVGRFNIQSDGTTTISGNLNASSGLDVTGAITSTGDITVPTSMDSTDAGGVAIQRFWSTSITAGNIYKCGYWTDGEGAVQLLITVRSITAANSGTSTYIFQGGFRALDATGNGDGDFHRRLMPLASGAGHGNGADKGLDNSGGWEVWINQRTGYQYDVVIHVPTGRANKSLQITVTELNRGNNFVDLSTSAAYSSITTNSNPILPSGYSYLGTTNLTGDLTISNTAPSIYFTDTNHDSDFRLLNQNGTFKIYDQTNGADRLEIFSGGTVAIDGNLDVGAGIDVTGNITVTGTVDGRDLAADGSKLDTYEANGSSYLRSDAVDSSSANLTINGLEVGSWALGAAYRGLFHTSQSGGEYMMISQDEHTFISATTGYSVYIRSGGNDATNQLIVGSGNNALTWRGNKIFHAGNDGSGSALDSDLLDGQHGSYYTNAANLTGTLPALDGSNLTGLTVNNAQTLDNLDSTQFLRSDANDTASGLIQLTSSSQYPLDINGSDDGKLLLRGSSNPYIRFREGNTDKAYIQWNSGGWLQLSNQETSESLRIIDGSNGLKWRIGSQNTDYIVWNQSNDGSGTGLDSDTLDGIQASSFLRSDADDTMSANLTIDNGTNTTLTVKCDDSGLALIRANGDSQGTGAVEVGQSDTYGGGIAYNGDGSPSFASGESSDHIIFYRLDNGTRTEVFHYPYNSNTVNFNARPTIGGVDIVKSTDTIAQATNASTLDNIDSGSFARSDIEETITGKFTFTSNGSYPIKISGTDDAKIVLKSSSNPFIRFQEGTTDKAYIQWNSNGYLELHNQETNEGLRIKSGNNGLEFTENGAAYRIFHAGNDGSGSGLDADTLDGFTSGQFLRSDTSHSTSGHLTFSDSGYSISDDYHIWKRTYSVNSSNPKELLDKDGNSLADGGAYRFTAHISATGTDNSARAVYWNQNGTWKLNVTYQSGTSSNHPEFILNNGVPTIHIDHSSTYAIHVLGERLELGEGTGADNKSGFGTDGYFSSTPSDLRYNRDGSGAIGSGNLVWHGGNDGSGSGLDADNLDGRTWSESASNSTIVSRNSSGYVFANYFNTTANDTGTGADVTRFYCSEDAYIRYIDKASMRSVMNVTARSGAFGGRETVTTDTNYWVGSMGWGSQNFDTTVWDYGSGFIDVWNNPSGQPSGTSHWQAIQSMHYSNGSARYGFRIACGAGQPSLLYVQGRWNTTTNGWYKLWNESNDGSGSGLDSDTVDGIQASSFLRSDANDNLGGVLSYTSDTSRLQFTNSSYSKSLYIGGWSSANSNGISRIRNSSDNLHIDCGAQGALYLNYYSTKQIYVASLWPRSNNTYDLGTSSNRWRNLYINDLNLSNEGSTNDVDGTWGSYTIQEGAEELYLINKRNGKKYKFNLTEVS